MVEDTSIMTNSICKECAFRICRKIIPPDYYFEEMGEELEDEDDRIQVIEHNYCKVLEMPIDHIVLECNRFYPDKEIMIVENEQVFGL